jgi:hypothetical protein
MATSLKKFRKKLIKNKPPPIVMPDAKNIAEECSLISLNETERSNERSSKKNPHEKTEHSIESEKAKAKKDKITSLKQQAHYKISNVMNLIDQKKNKHFNSTTKTSNIVIKPSKIKYFFSPKEVVQKPLISIVDKQLEEISPITV